MPIRIPRFRPPSMNRCIISMQTKTAILFKCRAVQVWIQPVSHQQLRPFLSSYYLVQRIRDAVQNPLNILKAAWAGKVSMYAAMVHEAGRSVQLLPVPISTLGGSHPDAHRALCSVATTIAARGMSTFSSAKSISFQRHAALLATNNALCLISGLVSGI